MAITIPGLPAASAAATGDLIEVSQSGVSKKETLAQVITLVNANAQLASASQVTGLGTAATKAISNVANTTVAGISGSITGGLAQFTIDGDGSLQDSGFTPSQFMTKDANLADVSNPQGAGTNIFAAKCFGFYAPDLTGADIALNNPCPTWIKVTNNNGSTGLLLPSPPDLESDPTIALQPAQILILDNDGGANAVPLSDSSSTPIGTIAANSVYLVTFEDTAGTVRFVKIK